MTTAPLTILVDTREQRPLTFSSDVTVVRATLQEGDYSVAGLEGRVAWERKSVADLVGSLTHGRDRFFAELDRLREYLFAGVIVEGALAEVTSGAYRSRAHPASMVGSVCMILADYRFPASAATGVLEAVDGFDEARAMPGIERARMYVGEGDRVKAAEGASYDATGEVMSFGDRYAEARERARAAMRRILLRVRGDDGSVTTHSADHLQ